jgi:predicted nucleic acid-binding protein
LPCLDTTVLIDLAPRADPTRYHRATNALAPLTSAGQVLCTTRLNVAELWVGVERSKDRALELSKIEAVLNGMPVLELDDAAARLFGVLQAHVLGIGRPAGDIDTLIAAVAMANGQPLVTRNLAHFANFPGLVVHSY